MSRVRPQLLLRSFLCDVQSTVDYERLTGDVRARVGEEPHGVEDVVDCTIAPHRNTRGVEERATRRLIRNLDRARSNGVDSDARRKRACKRACELNNGCLRYVVRYAILPDLERTE